MASLSQAHPQSIPGQVFVDTSCINCGTCYHLAPGIFEEADDEKSFVNLQPSTPHEWTQVKTAMVSCPTNSIGVEGATEEFRQAKLSLPMLIADDVYYCGYTSKDSFGASSYLIESELGNILIDCPRFHPSLVKELESMGGLALMILTHQDDVADHEKFAQHFGCERIIHKSEVGVATRGIEHQLELKREMEILPQLWIIPTPGHTKGHWAVLYKNEFLFTGDHIFFDQATGKLSASRGVCWHSWTEQMESVEKLLHFDFTWILPGHGAWGRPAAPVGQAFKELLESMRKQ